METNESIFTRQVVALDERRNLGKVKALRVDCDTQKISYYTISSASTASELVLPFANVLAFGDTFLTIQSADKVLPTVAPETEKVLKEGYLLLESDVFSRTGNRLGKISGFEFDPVFGTVSSILLDSGAAFARDTFVFFSPEFVFVNDGTPTAPELREQDDFLGSAEIGESSAADSLVAVDVDDVDLNAPLASAEDATSDSSQDDLPVEAPLTIEFAAQDAVDAGTPSVISEIAEEAETGETDAEDLTDATATAEGTADVDSYFGAAIEPVVESDIDSGIEEATESESEAEVEDEQVASADAEVESFLLGATINESVESADGAFYLASGTVITEDIIARAKKHDALLLLAVNVDA